MAGTTVKSSLQSLLSGEPIPTPPQARIEWGIDRYQLEMERFHTALLDYIRRLVGRLTSATIITEITTGGGGDTITIPTAWRYDATSHTFQKKTRDIQVISASVESGWSTITDGTQPTQVTDMVDWQYNTTSHQFEYKTRPQYVLEAGSVSSFSATGGTQPTSASVVGDWQYDTSTHKFQKKTRTVYTLDSGSLGSFADTSGGQPVELATVVEDVEYDTTSHVLSQDYWASVFVLEHGSETVDANVDTAVVCGS
jgi:hypothetical protein